MSLSVLNLEIFQDSWWGAVSDPSRIGQVILGNYDETSYFTLYISLFREQKKVEKVSQKHILDL